jgi:hypothetical protein
MATPMSNLLNELALVTKTLPTSAYKCGRIRIAVSPEEWNELREECLRLEGRWHGRLADIPLIIEDRNPERFVEFPPLNEKRAETDQ